MAEPTEPSSGPFEVHRETHFPGAFEGETVSRRRFMTVSANAAGAIAIAAFTLPALGFAIGPCLTAPAIPGRTSGPCPASRTRATSR
jgi:hypothetical protein